MSETTSPYSVLIVDDEPDLRELLKLEFQLRGWKAHSAESSQKAMQLLDQYQVNLVLSDVRMPGESGIDLLSKIKRSHSEIPVILMTGYADISREEAIQRGAFELLSKPFELDELNQVARNAVSR